MNSSGSATRSAPSRAACARARRALSALPAMSPTVGLSCAIAIARRSGGRAFMRLGLARRGGGPQSAQRQQTSPRRSASARSQTAPASSSARPTAAEPMSLTRPICGSIARRHPVGELFDRGVEELDHHDEDDHADQSEPLPGLSATTNASGTDSTSAASSCRNAASLRAACDQPVPGIDRRAQQPVHDPSSVRIDRRRRNRSALCRNPCRMAETTLADHFGQLEG